jgi:alginate O-acetyltransferase complex protein AlgJ
MGIFKMQKQTSRQYSFLFIAAFFLILIMQLSVRDLTLLTLPERFLWRDDLIKALNNVRFYIGDRVFPNAIMGRDGWMYYTGDKSIGDFQKILKVNPRETRASLENLAAFDGWVEENDGKLFWVVAPDKQTIYPQYMPDEIPVLGEFSRFDRVLTQWMELGLDVDLIDLRAPLTEASTVYQVYQKGDTHWNCIGAYFAYQEVMDRVSTIYPDVTSYSLTDYEIKYLNPGIRDIPGMLGIQHLEDGVVLSPKHAPSHLTTEEVKLEYKGSARVVENERKDLPTALVIHDSFYPACFNYFFEQHFSRTYSIPYAFVKDYAALIEEQKADIVIVETVERYLLTRLSYINSR